jgi:purine-binding chemotaxis protein CheW
LVAVDRVTRAAAITPISHSDSLIQGVINVHGELLPVINTRRMLFLPERDLDIDDVFILIQNNQRPMVLIADEVDQVITIDKSRIIPADVLVGQNSPWQSLLVLEDGLVLIQDLSSCLQACDITSQNQLLKEEPAHHG